MSEAPRAEVPSSARRLVHFACCALLAFLVGSTAAAQTAATPGDQDNYPNRTIRYVVPYPPGGFNDTLARIVSQKLAEAWGVPVVVENRPGGGTLIGTEAVAKAAPDGYTLLGVAFPFGTNPSIYKNLPYDTVKDFTPLILAGQTQNLLVIRPSMPINSVKELIDYAKKNPGKISYSSAGIGSSNHLSMELFKSMAGIEIVHVPLQRHRADGERPARRAHRYRLRQHTQRIAPGQCRKIASAWRQQQDALGARRKRTGGVGGRVPEYEVTVWFGIVGPAGMRSKIVRKLNAELNTIVVMNDVKRRFAE
jgi:tripartite-type tricarboxylate transporter receptor subunit TctC